MIEGNDAKVRGMLTRSVDMRNVLVRKVPYRRHWWASSEYSAGDATDGCREVSEPYSPMNLQRRLRTTLTS